MKKIVEIRRCLDCPHNLNSETNYTGDYCGIHKDFKRIPYYDKMQFKKHFPIWCPLPTVSTPSGAKLSNPQQVKNALKTGISPKELLQSARDNLVKVHKEAENFTESGERLYK